MDIFERKKQYEEIYDKICNYLDEEFKKNNYCDFRSDRCVANRLGKTPEDTMGCCYNFNEKLFSIKDIRVCEFQENEICKINCIGCKLFSCKYLSKRGVKFNLDKIPNINYKFRKRKNQF